MKSKIKVIEENSEYMIIFLTWIQHMSFAKYEAKYKWTNEFKVIFKDKDGIQLKVKRDVLKQLQRLDV